LSLCLIKQTSHHEDIEEWRYSITIDLGTRWRGVVSFVLHLLHLQGKSPWYPLERVEICMKNVSLILFRYRRLTLTMVTGFVALAHPSGDRVF
jgi:hypothetical protein